MARHSGPPTLLTLLEEGERDAVLARCTHRRFARGEQIVRERDTDTNIYFIDSGRVRVNLFSSEGKEVNFENLEQGDSFGEIAFVDGQLRSANVIALADTAVTIMPPDVFLGLLQSHPEAKDIVLKQFAAMIRRLCDRIFEHATVSVNTRIQAELLRLARASIDLDGVARIHNPPTHAELAAKVSCHREAVSRELKRLEKRGILAKERKKWIIADIDLLQEIVDAAMGR